MFVIVAKAHPANMSQALQLPQVRYAIGTREGEGTRDLVGIQWLRGQVGVRVALGNCSIDAPLASAANCLPSLDWIRTKAHIHPGYTSVVLETEGRGRREPG